MGDVISHNTELMREWSGSIEDCATDYDSYIKSLYSIIDSFIGSDFTGDVATELEQEILAKRDDFEGVTRFLEEVANLVTATSRKIDSDTDDLKQMINKSGIIG